MDPEEDAWEFYRRQTAFAKAAAESEASFAKASVDSKLDTLAAQNNEIMTTLDRLNAMIPGLMGDQTALDQDTGAVPDFGVGMDDTEPGPQDDLAGGGLAGGGLDLGGGAPPSDEDLGSDYPPTADDLDEVPPAVGGYGPEDEDLGLGEDEGGDLGLGGYGPEDEDLGLGEGEGEVPSPEEMLDMALRGAQESASQGDTQSLEVYAQVAYSIEEAQNRFASPIGGNPMMKSEKVEGMDGEKLDYVESSHEVSGPTSSEGAENHTGRNPPSKVASVVASEGVIDGTEAPRSLDGETEPVGSPSDAEHGGDFSKDSESAETGAPDAVEAGSVCKDEAHGATDIEPGSKGEESFTECGSVKKAEPSFLDVMRDQFRKTHGNVDYSPYDEWTFEKAEADENETMGKVLSSKDAHRRSDTMNGGKKAIDRLMSSRDANRELDNINRIWEVGGSDDEDESLGVPGSDDDEDDIPRHVHHIPQIDDKKHEVGGMDDRRIEYVNDHIPRSHPGKKPEDGGIEVDIMSAPVDEAVDDSYDITKLLDYMGIDPANINPGNLKRLRAILDEMIGDESVRKSLPGDMSGLTVGERDEKLKSFRKSVESIPSKLFTPRNWYDLGCLTTPDEFDTFVKSMAEREGRYGDDVLREAEDGIMEFVSAFRRSEPQTMNTGIEHQDYVKSEDAEAGEVGTASFADADGQQIDDVDGANCVAKTDFNAINMPDPEKEKGPVDKKSADPKTGSTDMLAIRDDTDDKRRFAASYSVGQPTLQDRMAFAKSTASDSRPNTVQFRPTPAGTAVEEAYKEASFRKSGQPVRMGYGVDPKDVVAADLADWEAYQATRR